MSALLDDNLQRLAILLRRAFPPDTTAISLHRIMASFVEQRNTSPKPHLYDLRTNQFLRDIEPTTGLGSDPQIIINHLVDLHDAGSSVGVSPSAGAHENEETPPHQQAPPITVPEALPGHFSGHQPATTLPAKISRQNTP